MQIKETLTTKSRVSIETALYVWLKLNLLDTDEVDYSIRSLRDLVRELGEGSINTCLLMLEEEGYIRIVKPSGYYPKLYILKRIDVPAFVNIDMHGFLKGKLSYMYVNHFDWWRGADKSTDLCLTFGYPIGSISSYYSMNRKFKLAGIKINMDLFEPITERISLDLGTQTERDENDHLKYVVQLDYKCSTCGTSDKSFFRDRQHALCNDCTNKKQRLKRSVLASHKPIEYFNTYASSCKSGAKRRFISCDITGEDLMDQYNKQKGLCYYCGEEFNMDTKFERPSIDRLDSTIGYTKDNIVWSWWVYNSMKNSLSLSDFKSYISKLKLDNI